MPMFEVEVQRTAIQFKKLLVHGETQADAEKKALEHAPDFHFTNTTSAEYEIVGVKPA